MEREDKITLVIAVVLLAGVAYVGRKLLPFGAMQPKYDVSKVGVSIGGVYSDILPAGVGEHFLPPDKYGGSTVVSPVKYPPRAGHEITTLINQGYAPLYRARPDDYDYISNPPADVNL